METKENVVQFPEEGENLLCVRNNMKVSMAKAGKDSARETRDEVGKATTS